MARAPSPPSPPLAPITSSSVSYELFDPSITGPIVTRSKKAENERSFSKTDSSTAQEANPLAGGDINDVADHQKAPLEVLHMVEWTDRNGYRKQNFHSNKPFPAFEIATKPLQPPEDLDSEAGEPILEVITPISGWAPPEKSSDTGLIDLKDIAVDDIGKTKIIIHSPLLIAAIRSVVTYYPDYDFTSEPFVSTEPHPVLMHHLPELRALHSRTAAAPSNGSGINQQATHEHLHHLLNALEPAIHRHISPAEVRISKPRPTITFDTLWLIFKPGVDVYVKWSKDFKDVIFTGVVQATSTKEPEWRRSKPRFDIEIWVLESDGSKMGRTAGTRSIEWFEDECEITSLEHYPASYWDAQDAGVRRRAIEARGHRHYKVLRSEPQQMRYDGRPYSSRREAYHGPVIIDLQAALQSEDFTDDVSSGWTFLSHELASPQSDKPGTPWLEYSTVKLRSKTSLTDHQAFLLQPMIAGYALNIKAWRILNVENLSESTFRSTAMDNLVMDERTRNIIQAVCHEQSEAWKIDYVQGKGEGQTVLLHGPPGVGKTYTVECISEATKRPLISLTAADIMEDEAEIERELTKWFSMAARWQAVLLLDEADIFLERREGGQIKRNGIVSTFLRKMEYFKGLLFLTTNRIGHIDDAFLSRVSVVIHYNRLDQTTRQKIWQGFFQKLEKDMQTRSQQASHEPPKPKIEISNEAKFYVLYNPTVEALEWNGREIRNALQTAICLAGYKATKNGRADQPICVTPDDFESVVHLSSAFRGYMQSIQNKDEISRARANLDRNDMYGIKK
ncbi:P-loop containing nucleoside triphosphate hydrolase [Lasallia pustulata]|uniref:p-loop containing nucleoside triphosphate hydrolase n=1 Tax=Lasallia pustulata TaxID=136370 RepID=A0A1W5DEG2_9LECA|nr:P-loop containing nucleoside triphosphate hydrolase [Lasallia pustulata]